MHAVLCHSVGTHEVWVTSFCWQTFGSYIGDSQTHYHGLFSEVSLLCVHYFGAPASMWHTISAHQLS